MSLGDSGFLVNDCELCEEVRLGGTAATGGTREPVGFSRLIRRTTSVDVLAGLGALVPGYLLIVPRRHINSIGELPSAELEHIYATAWNMARRVEDAFDTKVVLVEHGSSGDGDKFGRACIVHAHAHIFPVTSRDEDTFVPPGSVPVTGLEELRSLARLGENYYYTSHAPWVGRILRSPELPSQQARRIWAQMHNAPDEWDWALFPHYEIAKATASVLRRDVMPGTDWDDPRGALADTIHAYRTAADWYASRTQHFPPRSTLRAEISELTDRTTGRILDAGAGAGRDARAFAECGRRVVALDASPELLAYVRDVDIVDRVVGDVRTLPLADESVGAIWCSAVLLHMGRADIFRTLIEFRRVLAPGGLLQVSVKEGTGHISALMGDSKDLQRHFYFYEMSDLDALVRSAGLTTLEHWVEDEYEGSGVVQRWIKALARRELD